MNKQQFDSIKNGFVACMYFIGYWQDEPGYIETPEIDKGLSDKIDTIITNFVESVGGVGYLLELPDQSHEDLNYGNSHLAGIGCDLCHTISGSGVGFFDGDYGEHGNHLTEKAESVCRHFSPYWDADTNKLYI